MRSVYLCGQMDALLEDHGATWRAQIAMRLRSRAWRVFNPCENEAELPEAREHRALLKAGSQWSAFSREMNDVRRVDLGQVALSEVLVVHLEPGVPGCGTWFEIAYAKALGKSIFVHCRDLCCIPDWLWSELPYERFFDSWDTLLCELESSTKVAA